ncbi:MAG: insulinase family protein [Firmicutes bacterium]|nr:insulinase family protein [Bacillota bacterium]
MSKKRILCYLLAVVVFAGTIASAAPVDPHSTLMPLQMQVFSNGMRVIVKEIPSYPIATVNVWVNAGSVHDPDGLSGLAHFFEHLIFQGTPQRPKGQISSEVESLGGYLNAMTSYDYTTYFIVVPSEHAAQAMEIQADALLNPLFDQQEIDRERSVIHEEIRLRDSSPQTYLVDRALEGLFEDTIYSNPVIGTIEDLDKINREQMVKFHNEYYVPNNMVLVVTGNVDAGCIFEQAKELYGGMDPGVIPAGEHIVLPQLEQSVTSSSEREVEQSYIFLGYPAPGLNTHDAAALTMAGILLGGGRSSYLYRELVEKEHIVNSVSASYSGFSEIGLFGIYAALDPDNTELFLNAARKEVERLQTEPVTPEELARVRAMARSSLAFSMESSSDLALFLGQMEIYGGVMGAVNRSAILEQITAEDIQRAAGLYLDPDAYIRSEIIPAGR